MFTSQVGSTADGTVLKLSGDLTIQNAEDLKALLGKINEGSGNLSLDLSEIGAIDVAGLQLLCSAHKAWLATGRSITCQGDAFGPVARLVTEAGYTRKEPCMFLAQGRCLWTGGRHE